MKYLWVRCHPGVFNRQKEKARVVGVGCTRERVELDEVRNVGKGQTVQDLVGQWFPDLSEHRNHLEDLLNLVQVLGPHP